MQPRRPSTRGMNSWDWALNGSHMVVVIVEVARMMLMHTILSVCEQGKNQLCLITLFLLQKKPVLITSRLNCRQTKRLYAILRWNSFRTTECYQRLVQPSRSFRSGIFQAKFQNLNAKVYEWLNKFNLKATFPLCCRSFEAIIGPLRAAAASRAVFCAVPAARFSRRFSPTWLISLCKLAITLCDISIHICLSNCLLSKSHASTKHHTLIMSHPQFIVSVQILSSNEPKGIEPIHQTRRASIRCHPGVTLGSCIKAPLKNTYF